MHVVFGGPRLIWGIFSWDMGWQLAHCLNDGFINMWLVMHILRWFSLSVWFWFALLRQGLTI